MGRTQRQSVGLAALPYLLRTAGRQQQAIQEHNQRMFATVEKFYPEDIAETVVYIVTRPRPVAINEIMARATYLGLPTRRDVRRLGTCLR